jgi:hypothetical protein
MVTKTNKFESPPQHKNPNLKKIKCKHKFTSYQDNKNDGYNMQTSLGHVGMSFLTTLI